MRQILISFTILIVLFSCTRRENTATYTNPLSVEFGDPFILHASDGKFYMYGTTDNLDGFKAYSSDNLVDWTDEGQDFSDVIGTPVLLLRPPVVLNDKQAEWESRSVTANEVNRRWTEGSYLIKHNDIYYMMYSANFFGGQYYAVGYATSDNPLGPFTKSDNNPVLQKNTDQGGDVTGTGHNMILTLPNGEMCCVYHGRTTKTGDKRVVFISKMEIKENGDIVIIQ